MRTVLSLSLVVAGAVVSAASAIGAETRTPEAAVAVSAPDPVQARQADDLVDAFGVQTHLAYPGTPYQDLPRVKAALTDLGVRHVRDQLYANKPPLYDAMREIAEAGIRFNVIMGNPISWETPELLVAHLAYYDLAHSVVESLEGANEWNLKGRLGWAKELREHQERLWDAAKAEPETARLPILAPALGLRSGYAALGDLSEHADFGNAHNYPGGRKPSFLIEEVARAEEQHVVPGKPVIFTESGYHNATNTLLTHPPTPEDVHGDYAPKLLLEHFLAGTERFYSYELLDERPDPEKSDHEANFGLLRHDFSPKPAYTALKGLLALANDPGRDFEPGSLRYDVTKAPWDLREVLLQKRDGTFLLVLWRDVSTYDPLTRLRLPVAPDTVELRLAEDMRVTVSSPSGKGTRVADPVTAATVPIAVDEGISVVEVTPVAGDEVAGDTRVEPQLSTPTAPRKVVVRERPRGHRVSWRAPEDDGGTRITGYRVIERRSGRAVTVGPARRNVTVRWALKQRKVQFVVRARNRVGLGPRGR